MMTDDQQILREIKRDERWLGELVEAVPLRPFKAIAQTRDAVRVELEHDAVGRFDDPVPSEATMTRVRHAVAEELGRSDRWVQSRGLRWAIGVASAAACLVATIGLVRFGLPTVLTDGGTDNPSAVANRPTDPTTGGSRLAVGESAEQMLEDMTVAFRTVSQEGNAALSILAEDIDLLTESSLDGDSDPGDAELQSIGEEIRGLLSQRSLSLES